MSFVIQYSRALEVPEELRGQKFRGFVDRRTAKAKFDESLANSVDVRWVACFEPGSESAYEDDLANTYLGAVWRE